MRPREYKVGGAECSQVRGGKDGGSYSVSKNGLGRAIQEVGVQVGDKEVPFARGATKWL